MMVYLYIKVCNNKTQDQEDDIGGEKIRTNSVNKNLFPKHLFNSLQFFNIIVLHITFVGLW